MTMTTTAIRIFFGDSSIVMLLDPIVYVILSISIYHKEEARITLTICYNNGIED